MRASTERGGALSKLPTDEGPKRSRSKRGRQGELFAVPALRSFHLPRPGDDRIGVVDVGSNSVRMVVFESQRRCPSMVFNEKASCGLGAELETTGRLSPEGVERAMAALHRFVLLAPGLKIGALAGVATAAVREASDGSLFRNRVEEETGIKLQIASGADEARLAAQGVIFGDPDANGLVVDLGGASMEFCPVKRGHPGHGATTPLGPLRIGDEADDDSVRELIARHLEPLVSKFGTGDCIYLVGGAWRALGRVVIHQNGHPLNILHEFSFSPTEARGVIDYLHQADTEMLRAVPGLPSGRMDVLNPAALLLEALIEHFQPREFSISGFGLREGVCFDFLPQNVKAQDPLISTCQGQEKTRARSYGFGTELGRWVLEALQPEDDEERRLIRAAAHLADVSWRAHPDFRATACMEVVTRVNVSSAGHHGRAMMAAMLLCRYKGGRKAISDEPAMALLTPEERDRAQQIGAVLRLGCTLSGAVRGALERVPLSIEDGLLVLDPARDAGIMMGEEVSKRLGQAARALSLAPRLGPLPAQNGKSAASV
ncbi:MAG: Ppx/GppA phosphatase family protein [Pseudomonadota bacterium]